MVALPSLLVGEICRTALYWIAASDTLASGAQFLQEPTMEFTRASKSRAYRAVVDQVSDAITSADLQAGDMESARGMQMWKAQTEVYGRCSLGGRVMAGVRCEGTWSMDPQVRPREPPCLAGDDDAGKSGHGGVSML